jgi:D-alanyl-D-alanine carboxypeptidase
MIAKAWVVIGVALTAVLARADAVDDYVQAEMRKRHIPGIGVAVVRDGKVEKTAGYGMANVELHVPVSPQTVFQIQSVTKTFTSAAILMLVEEGKIALDDPIGKHLEGTPESWKGITIRHLLSHTSGIKDFINEPTASLRIDVTEEEVLKATAPRPLNFPTGEKYSYSNTNYHLLAMVIRKLTGKSYGDFLKERIFTPLGMNDTRIVSWSDIIPNRAAGYAWAGNSLRNGQYVAESILSYGGGGVVSTAADMAKWALAADQQKLLPKAVWEQAWTSAKLNDGTKTGYGLGWGVSVTNGHRNIGHGGAHMTGFTSNLVIYRDDHLAVIVLTNAGHANPGRMAQQIAATYIPALKPQTAKAIEDKEPKVAELLRDLSGQVRDGKLKSEQFTPQLWAILSLALKDLQEQSRQDGDLKSLELLARSEDKGERTYRYRMIMSNNTYLIRLTLEKDGRVSGLWAEEE